jgi:hypothetical protein
MKAALVLSMVFLGAVAQATPFRSEKNGYSLDVPAGLAVSESGDQMMAAGPLDGQPAFVMALAMPTPDGSTWTVAMAQQVGDTMVGTGTVVQKGTCKVAGGDHTCVTYDMKAEGMRVQVAIVPRGKTLFVFGFGTPRGPFSRSPGARTAMFASIRIDPLAAMVLGNPPPVNASGPFSCKGRYAAVKQTNPGGSTLVALSCEGDKPVVQVIRTDADGASKGKETLPLTPDVWVKSWTLADTSGFRGFAQKKCQGAGGPGPENVDLELRDAAGTKKLTCSGLVGLPAPVVKLAEAVLYARPGAIRLEDAMKKAATGPDGLRAIMADEIYLSQFRYDDEGDEAPFELTVNKKFTPLQWKDDLAPLFTSIRAGKAPVCDVLARRCLDESDAGPVTTFVFFEGKLAEIKLPPPE